MRHKVYVLYAFVRLADEYVDNPAEGSDPKERLEQFRDQFNAAWKGLRVTSPLSQEENKVIHTFVALAKNESFEKPWIDGFFTSMEWDIWRTRRIRISPHIFLALQT